MRIKIDFKLCEHINFLHFFLYLLLCESFGHRSRFYKPWKVFVRGNKTTYPRSVKYVCHLRLTSFLIPSCRSAPYFLHLCTHPPTILPTAHLRPKSSLPLETVVIRPTSESQRGETNNTPPFTQTELWGTPQRACVCLWMGVTEIKMDGSRLLAFVFFTGGKLPPCHHTPLSEISSIASHPSEPSAPAAITQYLSGAEDKQVLRAASRHLLPFNSPWRTYCTVALSLWYPGDVSTINSSQKCPNNREKFCVYWLLSVG